MKIKKWFTWFYTLNFWFDKFNIKMIENHIFFTEERFEGNFKYHFFFGLY